ncbi:MAG: ribulose-phosphate 3-epimerase [Clostridia bacterium]|nr:ribulose-phosphate 3-epimerase [Clostridia bacterium]
MKISPSILNCDYTDLRAVMRFLEDLHPDMIHLDVMDGVFVPNLSFGPPVIEALRPLTDLPFDVHLMMQHPDRLIDAFAKAGADSINIHVESDAPIDETLQHILDLGKKAAITIKPKTPVEAAFPYLDKVSMVLVMSVEPGFGGQSFMHDMMPKVTALKEEIRRRGLSTIVQVDGGVDAATAPICAEAGADCVVVGSAIFKTDDPVGLVSIVHGN